jgi:Mrp family chromosome partitioning ATPase
MSDPIASHPPAGTLAAGPAHGAPPLERVLAARYAAALREHWLYVLLTVALAVAAAGAYVALAEKRYEATSDLVVAAAPNDVTAALPVLRGAAGRDVGAAALLAKSPEVASQVRAELGLRMGPSELGELIRVSTDRQAGTLSITGIGGSPDAAAAIANAFAGALLAVRTERFQEQLRGAIERTSRRLAALSDRPQSREARMLSTRLADYRTLTDQPDPTVQLVGAAAVPSEPAWPRPLATLLVAGIGGLLLGLVVAVALELRTPIVVHADELAEVGGPPILARLPALADGEVRQLLVGSEPSSARLRESARSLSAIVGGLLPSWSHTRTFLVTSADEGEGSPAVAAALASVTARAGMAVALVDGDLERGPLAAVVDGAANPTPSVGQVLMSRDPRELLDPIPPVSASEELRVLLSYRDRHLAGLVPPHRVAWLARELKARVGGLVISAPPLPSPESWFLLDSADTVIVVVALGRTRRDKLAKLRHVLALSDRAPFGYVVLERPGIRTRLSRLSLRHRGSLRHGLEA